MAKKKTVSVLPAPAPLEDSGIPQQLKKKIVKKKPRKKKTPFNPNAIIKGVMK